MVNPDEEPYLTISNRFENIEFIGNGRMVIGVPFDAPNEYKRMVWAASECYIHGNRSIDYFYKRHCEKLNFDRPDAPRRRLSRIIQQSIQEVDRIGAEFTNGITRETTTGLFASESALTRLRTSFQSAAFLLMQGSLYEASALMRMALEQMAWSYTVHGYVDGGFFKVNPTRCITRLKEIVPGAGRLYSQLSDYAHLQPDLQRQYLDFSEEYAAVIYRNHDDCLRMGANFSSLVRDYAIVSEYISYRYFKSPKAWVSADNGTLERDPNYDFASKVISFMSDVFGP